jgi:predicted SprT family Zn-dependent metalloprotease
MPKKEKPIDHLQQFLPDGTYDAVLQHLQFFKVHLTISKERKSILGDYRHRTHFENHRISINGNLNKFSFLITLLHELAHLLTFEQSGNKVAAHGKEWKLIYGQLLHQFIENKIFPAPIENALKQSLSNPAASSCAEDDLVRVLRKYDDAKSHVRLIEEISLGTIFQTGGGRIFKRGEKIRKRFKCTEIKTGRIYLFSPVYEVEIIQN